MVEFTEELRQEYFNAVCNLTNGCNEPMQRFKGKYPELFSMVNAMYHKRKTIRDNVKCMRKISEESLVFGCLTYDNEHDEECERTKRRQATRYLNLNFDVYLFVEEHGSDNERYHIHFIGILKSGITYNAFHDGWHSFSQIEKVIKVESTINYLTDYVAKQVPRIRRNKKLVDAFKHYQKSLMWERYKFKDSFAKEELESAINLVFNEL